MNPTIKPDQLTYSNSHQNALACDFDIMPIKDDLPEKKHLFFWESPKLGEIPVQILLDIFKQ